MALPFSIKICHTAIILFLLTWICEGSWSSKFDIIKQNFLILLIIAFFLVEAVSVVYTNNAGWFESEKKIFLLLVPVALATTSVRLSTKELHGIFYLFVASCFVGSVICLSNAFSQISLLTQGSSSLSNLMYLSSSDFKDLNPAESDLWLLFSYSSLSEGIHIHPTYFSLYIAFSITFLLFQLHNTSNSRTTNFIFWALIAYFSFFIVFLSTRIIIISLSVIFIIVMLRLLSVPKKRMIGIVMCVLTLLFCSLLYTNPVSRYRNLQEITAETFHIEPNNTYKNSAQIRASLWVLALKSYASVNPIWGTGTGDVTALMKRTSLDYNITNTIGSYDPHNQFLFTLIGLGVIGLTLLIGLAAVPLYLAWTQKDYLFVAFIFLFFSLCVTESALELQKGIVFFTLFFSLQAFSQKSYSFRFMPFKRLAHVRS